MLQKRIERLALHAAVVWIGRLTDAEASAVLGAADVFVAPFDDGVSIRRGSLMAGIAHGLPVVSTRAARESVYVHDGDNIALVPPRDAAALAARLTALLAAPEERARLAGARFPALHSGPAALLMMGKIAGVAGLAYVLARRLREEGA